MPHSGGGGSHSGGGHHGGGHSGGHSSGSSTRVSSTPFSGGRPYAVYDRHGHSRIVYANTLNYHAEMTKGQLIANIVFGSIFMLPGVIELIAILVLFLSFFHFGVRKTEIPPAVDSNVYIYDEMDLVSTNEEQELTASLERFRDETGIIPAVEFTVDPMWHQDYGDMESFAYNEYVCRFSDEHHLLIVYSFGSYNSSTGFNEFNWESMWGDDLSKTANTNDEDFLADTIQRNLTVANGEGVANAIAISFDSLYERLNQTGFRVDTDKLFVMLFLFVHGGIFFAVGLLSVLSAVKKYKKSQESGEKTYPINGEPVIMTCEYCDTTYYRGTIGNCHNCGAPLKY